MILGGGLITQALAGGGGSGGKVKPITITENGTYNVSDAEKAEGYVGFAPVTVDVPQSSGSGGLSAQSIATFASEASLTFGRYEVSVRFRNVSTLKRCNIAYPKTDEMISDNTYYITTKEYYRLLCKDGYPVIGSAIGEDYQTKWYRVNEGTVYLYEVDTSQGAYTSITPSSVTDGGRVTYTMPYTITTEYFYPTGESIRTQTRSYTGRNTYNVFPYSGERDGFPNYELSVDELIAIAKDVAETFYNTFKST